MITIQCHNNHDTYHVYYGTYVYIYDGELVADFNKEDLLTPDVDITEEEKQRMKDDITIMNTRKQRIEMALMEVLQEYQHTRIDER